MSVPGLVTLENPLRMVAGATWDLLLASSQVRELFKPGNRIMHYHGPERTDKAKQQPVKDEVGAGGLPELWLFQTGYRPWAYRDTTRSSIDIEWTVAVSTGAQHMGRLLDAEWIIWRALFLWDEQLESLEWEGNTFVGAARPLKVETSRENRELNRGIMQWTDLWRGETRLWFMTSDLRGGL